MSRRQQRRRSARRRAHMVAASGGLAVVASLSTGSVAQAAQTFTVTNLTDCNTDGCGSLRAAINAVDADTTDTGSPGDAIVFASGLSGTIALSNGELELTRSAQIYGPGADVMTIQAQPGNRSLYLDAYASVSGLSFTGGHPSTSDHNGYGGAILSYRSLKLSGVVVSGNASPSLGGGIYGRSLTLNHSTIDANSASGAGGGVYATDGIYSYNSTIAQNTATQGAGVQVDWFSSITGTTLVANHATGAGGQFFQAAPSKYVNVLDSIVAGDGSSPDMVIPSGNRMDVRYSLVRNPSSGGTGDRSVPMDATDISALDPQLTPLGLNGGPTPTMVPLPTSPVLDRGNNFGLTKDQRGLPRQFPLPTVGYVPPGGDRSDIGAVETETPSIAAIAPASGNAGTSVGIVGVGFTGATQVLFGDTPATSFAVLNDGAIRAVAPIGAGTEDVRVITPLGESPVAGSDRFAFPAFSPTVSSPHASLSGRTLKTGITVRCPSGGLSCAGTYKATHNVGGVNARIAHGSISLSAGQSKAITFRLGSNALHLLRTKGRLKITIQFVIADGKQQPIKVNRTITLAVHRAKHKKKH